MGMRLVHHRQYIVQIKEQCVDTTIDIRVKIYDITHQLLEAC